MAFPNRLYRAFELAHRLGDERLLVDGLHHTVDAWVVRDGVETREVKILLTNHALPRQAIGAERVRIALSGAAEPREAFAERVDRDHANPKREWRAMGSPRVLSTRPRSNIFKPRHAFRESLSMRVCRRHDPIRNDFASSCCRRGHAGILTRDEPTAELACRNESPAVDDEWLHALQKATFRYFWQQTNPENGLIPDNTLRPTPASIAGVGLALATYAVGVDRRFITRAQALERTLADAPFF